MKFRHPSNDYIVEANYMRLWVFLFGPLYFAFRGIWGHFFLSLLLAIPTFGISWIYYVIAAPGIVRKHYLERGWKET